MASSNSSELSPYGSGLIDSFSNPVDCILACDADAMTHKEKIIIGLRLDGIDKFIMENSHIYNMHDTKIGSLETKNFYVFQLTRS